MNNNGYREACEWRNVGAVIEKAEMKRK